MKISVAPRGWLNEAWSGFYPPDIPTEWRFDFFCNEFDAVVVPPSHWHHATEKRLRSWLTKSSDEFAFIPLLDLSHSDPKLSDWKRTCALLAERIPAILVRSDSPVYAGEDLPKDCLFSGKPVILLDDHAAEKDDSPIGDGTNEVIHCQTGPGLLCSRGSVAAFDLDHGCQPQQVRHVIEQAREEEQRKQLVLFGSDIKCLRAAALVAQLMN